MTFSNANASFLGILAGDWAGWEIDGVGDVDGDSYTDIVISAPTRITFPSRTQSLGNVYLIVGGPNEKWKRGTSLAQADSVLTSEQAHAGYGFHVQGIGDVNNDSLGDFAIGAPDFDDSYYNAGKTYIILNPPWTTAATTTNATTTTTSTTPPIDDTPPPAPYILIIAGTAVVVMVIALILRRRS